MSFDELDALQRLARAEVARVRTCIPGVVTAYDSATQRADVRPAIRHAYRDADGSVAQEQHPIIPGCPVLFPASSSGGFSIAWPLSPGDEVLVLVAERSIDEWQAEGNTDTVPQDLRRFALSDAMVLPVSTRGAADTASGAIVVQGSEVRLGSSSASQAVALGPVVDAQLTSLEAALTAWVPVPGDGGAALKALLTALVGTGWPASTGATKTKAE